MHRLLCHSRVQDKYVAPAVDEYWTAMQEALLTGCKEPLVLAGDGRNDSPGHCAQWCTYSLLDTTSKKIVSLKVVETREVDLKSTNMEKVGLIAALDEVMEVASVSELVTDAHVQIRAMMSKLHLNYINDMTNGTMTEPAS